MSRRSSIERERESDGGFGIETHTHNIDYNEGGEREEKKGKPRKLDLLQQWIFVTHKGMLSIKKIVISTANDGKQGPYNH